MPLTTQTRASESESLLGGWEVSLPEFQPEQLHILEFFIQLFENNILLFKRKIH